MIKFVSKKNLSTCVNGETYMYKSHPHPSRCEIVNTKINMLCTVCNKNITNNWCECSSNKKLLHEDRVMMRNAIKSLNHLNETKQKFLEKKGCSIEFFKSIFMDNNNNNKNNTIQKQIPHHGKGEGSWSFDHIISPVKDFDLTNKKHQAFIFHYKNIQKLNYPDNQQKGCKVVQSEIDYVLSVIDTMDVDKIHDQLVIIRKEMKIETTDTLDIETTDISIEKGKKDDIIKGKKDKIPKCILDLDKRKQNKQDISKYFSKTNTIINRLLKDKEKEILHLNTIQRRIDSINELIHLEIEKSYNEIRKQNSDIDLKMNDLQEKKNKNKETISLLYDYLNQSSKVFI